MVEKLSVIKAVPHLPIWMERILKSVEFSQFYEFSTLTGAIFGLEGIENDEKNVESYTFKEFYKLKRMNWREYFWMWQLYSKLTLFEEDLQICK